MAQQLAMMIILIVSLNSSTPGQMTKPNAPLNPVTIRALDYFKQVKGQSFEEYLTRIRSSVLAPDLKARVLKMLPRTGATRINVTILERELSRETHLQTVGYTISRGDLKRLSGLLECAIKPEDVVVFGGSLPPGSSEAAADDLVMLCKKLGAYVILDASGPALLAGLPAQPHMVKPNLLELSQILGRPVQNSDKIGRAHV